MNTLSTTHAKDDCVKVEKVKTAKTRWLKVRQGCSLPSECPQEHTVCTDLLCRSGEGRGRLLTICGAPGPTAWGAIISTFPLCTVSHSSGTNVHCHNTVAFAKIFIFLRFRKNLTDTAERMPLAISMATWIRTLDFTGDRFWLLRPKKSKEHRKNEEKRLKGDHFEMTGVYTWRKWAWSTKHTCC